MRVVCVVSVVVLGWMSLVSATSTATSTSTNTKTKTKTDTDPQIVWDGVWPQFKFPEGSLPTPPKPPAFGGGDMIAQGYPAAPPPPKAPPPPPPPPAPIGASSMFVPDTAQSASSSSQHRFKGRSFVETADARARAHSRLYAAARSAADSVGTALRRMDDKHPGHHHDRKREGRSHQQTLGPSFLETGRKLRGGAGGAGGEAGGAVVAGAAGAGAGTVHADDAAKRAQLTAAAAALRHYMMRFSAYRAKRQAALDAETRVGASQSPKGATTTAGAAGTGASFLQTGQSASSEPMHFVNPLAGLQPHQYTWSSIPTPNGPIHSPVAPAFLPFGSFLPPDQVYQAGIGSGSGSNTAPPTHAKKPTFAYYDPYHPPPHLPYGWQPYAPYNAGQYHPMPPAGLWAPNSPFMQPTLGPARIPGRR